jgi:hypothetical protein
MSSPRARKRYSSASSTSLSAHRGGEAKLGDELHSERWGGDARRLYRSTAEDERQQEPSRRRHRVQRTTVLERLGHAGVGQRSQDRTPREGEREGQVLLG